MGRDVFLRMNHSWKTHQLVVPLFFLIIHIWKHIWSRWININFRMYFVCHGTSRPTHLNRQRGVERLSDVWIMPAKPLILNYYFISIVFFIFQHNIRILTKPIDVNCTLYFICPKRLVYTWFFRWNVNCVSKSRFWKPFELCFEILFVCIFINSCRYIRKKGYI